MTGSSILTVLGVVCFATILVAAALITSGFQSVGTTTVTPAGTIAITPGTPTAASYVGDEAQYPFSANVPDTLSGTVLNIKITDLDGMVLSDVSHVYVTYDIGTKTEVTNLAVVDAANDYITGSYTVGAQAQDTDVPITVFVTYAAGGTYTVAIELSGTGSA